MNLCEKSKRKSHASCNRKLYRLLYTRIIRARQELNNTYNTNILYYIIKYEIRPTKDALLVRLFTVFYVLLHII